MRLLQKVARIGLPATLQHIKMTISIDDYLFQWDVHDDAQLLAIFKHDMHRLSHILTSLADPRHYKMVTVHLCTCTERSLKALPRHAVTVWQAFSAFTTNNTLTVETGLSRY